VTAFYPKIKSRFADGRYTMNFAKPEYLFALLSLPAAGLFLLWARRKREQALARLGDRALLRKLTRSINWRGRGWRNVLMLLSLTLLIIAMARPQWGSESREINQEGLQVMVALDVSQSMLAQDIKPTRLERAKLEIADLMKQLDGDEVGLVLFSGASFIQVPLTSDYFTALNYLDSAHPDVISRPGTVIGDAIHTAMYGYDPNLASQKVLIIMTDGEDHETDPLAAAKEAADEGVLIYTIGFGTPEGEPIPITDEYGQIVDYKRDQAGEVVLSQLDENTLQAIAQTGNGKYYRASADGSELVNLLAEIETLQKDQLQSRVETRFIERYQIFLAAALVLLVISELIPDRLTDRLSPSRSWRVLSRRQTRTKDMTPTWVQE
jgi:Ca-activated chloride channel family protein